MEVVQSLEEIVPVVVRHDGETSEVWLSRLITELEKRTEDGSIVPIWFAQQTHGTVQGSPSVEDIEADFDTWWAEVDRA